MSVRLIPKFDTVLIKKDVFTAPKGSIIALPSQVQKDHAPAKGTVIAVGPTCGWYKGETLIESIKVGSKVIYAKFAGTMIKEDENDKDSQEYWLVKDHDILCEVEEV